MKKGILLLLIFAIMSNALAQFFCGNNDTLEISNRSGCSRYKPQNAEDTMLYMQRFIPDESTPVKTIPLNINAGEMMMGREAGGRIAKRSVIVCR